MKLSLWIKFRPRTKIIAIKFTSDDVVIDFDSSLGSIRLPFVRVEIEDSEVYIKQERGAPWEFGIRYMGGKVIMVDEVYYKKEVFSPNAKHSFTLNGCKITYEPPPCSSTNPDWGIIEIKIPKEVI